MYYKKKKPRNMATGGLMSQPPFIAKQDEEDNGINPYDVNTPESARQGLPSRLLSKKRTRFNKGGFPDLDGSGDTTMKDILMGRGVIPKPKNKNGQTNIMKRNLITSGLLLLIAAAALFKISNEPLTLPSVAPWLIWPQKTETTPLAALVLRVDEAADDTDVPRRRRSARRWAARVRPSTSRWTRARPAAAR